METLVEQRGSVRTNLSWPISVWLPEANRFFNGQSSNVSKSGALVLLPLTAPIRAGQVVEVNFPRTAVLAEEKGGFARIKKGKVVRVERTDMLKDATVAVAVAFD
jgi:type IV secretory pathway protease TraF